MDKAMNVRITFNMQSVEDAPLADSPVDVRLIPESKVEILPGGLKVANSHGVWTFWPWWRVKKLEQEAAD